MIDPSFEGTTPAIYWSYPNGTAPLTDCGNVTYVAYVESIDEEEAKRRHAEECRRRDLGYLWKPVLTPRRLRFKVFAPFIRFMPCWSARRWRSAT